MIRQMAIATLIFTAPQAGAFVVDDFSDRAGCYAEMAQAVRELRSWKSAVEIAPRRYGSIPEFGADHRATIIAAIAKIAAEQQVIADTWVALCATYPPD